MSSISSYEDHLALRVELKEIKKITAYIKLQILSHFIQYLYNNRVINFKYSIPSRFQGNKVSRDNEYVSNKERFALINAIHSKNGSSMVRDIAICLLFIDTGCRPIEVSNMRLEDFNFSESSVILYSRKSGQRKLKIDPFVMDYIKKHSEIRHKLPIESEFMFLQRDGQQMSTKSIGAMINSYNKEAFGMAKFSAKSLRHTSITNQLLNKNSFEQVAQSAGHKHLISTLHYLYRSIGLLLENSLPHNPYEGLDEIYEV